MYRDKVVMRIESKLLSYVSKVYYLGVYQVYIVMKYIE